MCRAADEEDENETRGGMNKRSSSKNRVLSGLGQTLEPGQQRHGGNARPGETSPSSPPAELRPVRGVFMGELRRGDERPAPCKSSFLTFSMGAEENETDVGC